MEPYQVELLTMVMVLLSVMVVSAAASAYAFRNIFGWPFFIGSFVLAIVLIFVSVFVGTTNNPVLIIPAVAMFGAAMGATLGSFILAVTHGKKRGAEAVMVTLAVIAIAMLVTAVIGLMSGFNFQGFGGILFAILLGILGITVIGIFVKFNKVVEMIIGLGISFFFMVYMVYDFNKVVDLYNEASWRAAMEIAMNIFLDLLNIFVRLLPIIVDILDAMD